MKHISYSEFRNFWECPYRRWLGYDQGIWGDDSKSYFSFGKATHEACEMALLGRPNMIPFDELMTLQFVEDGLIGDRAPAASSWKTMISQGNHIIKEYMPALLKHFGPFEPMRTEAKLYEPIPGLDPVICFKGFVDAQIKTIADGIFHILDLKTAVQHWAESKLMDRKTIMQLQLYAAFFCLKHNLPYEAARAHYVIMSRNARIGTKIRIYDIPFDAEIAELAIKRLKTIIKQIQSGLRIKRQTYMSCKFCQYKNTEHCK